MSTTQTKSKACKVPKCKKTQKTRGLCAGHYGVALKLVRMEKITWEELESAGKSNPVNHARTGPVQEWFLAAKAAK